MGYWKDKLIQIEEDTWRLRVTQLQTVLSAFNDTCSFSVEQTDGTTVRVKAHRVYGTVEVETTRPAHLNLEQIDTMVQLGWTPPEPPTFPDLRRTITNGDLHEHAAAIANTLQQVYGIRGHETWLVDPPEFSHTQHDLAPVQSTTAHETAAILYTLRHGTGITLAAAIARDTITFADCLAAGLSRADRFAELAMLYRPDCPVTFLRNSAPPLAVLRDTNLPLATAHALLAADPSALEIRLLSTRTDIDKALLAKAAVRGHRLATWYGRRGGPYLPSPAMPVSRLRELADRHEDEAAAMLRHPNAPKKSSSASCSPAARTSATRPWPQPRTGTSPSTPP